MTSQKHITTSMSLFNTEHVHVIIATHTIHIIVTLSHSRPTNRTSSFFIFLPGSISQHLLLSWVCKSPTGKVCTYFSHRDSDVCKNIMPWPMQGNFEEPLNFHYLFKVSVCFHQRYRWSKSMNETWTMQKQWCTYKQKPPSRISIVLRL